MRAPVGLSKQMNQALPQLRKLARKSAKRHGCEADDAYQIACEEAVRVEPQYNPADPSGASFVTFVWTYALGAIARHAEKGRRHSAMSAAARDAGLGFARSIPSQTPRFDESDEELHARVDDIRFSLAGTMFVAAAHSLSHPSPSDAYEIAERRRRVLRALNIALDDMEPEAREILERHAVRGETLGSLLGSMPRWRDLDEKAARYQWRKLMGEVGRAIWRNDVAPESVKEVMSPANA